LTIFLYSTTVKAQISVFQSLIDKVESYDNFGYQSIIKRKDGSADTTVAFNQEKFLKRADDKLYGYVYRIEIDYKTEKFHTVDLYNEEGLTILSMIDSTFFPKEGTSVEYSRSLIGSLKFLKDRYNKQPFRTTMLKDTIINNVANSHLVAKVYDTLDNNEHLYSYRSYYIEKQTGLPSLVTIEGRYKNNGLVSDYYDETKYLNYNLDELDLATANFNVPKTFKPREKQSAPLDLLAVGTTAPDWTLYDANGKKLSLSELKGKVVLLDFYFIGCSGCMASIIPLNTIFEKFRNQDLIIASLTERDSKDAVLDFEKRYKVKFTGYINAADVVKSYHVTAFPTYYFIDKVGKVGNVFVGVSDDFEEKVTSVVNDLLGQK
jgi:peroxiredoxin